MINESVKQKIFERYSHIHPLILNRSCSYASSAGDLFDILEGIPYLYPITWDKNKKKWISIEDIRIVQN